MGSSWSFVEVQNSERVPHIIAKQFKNIQQNGEVHYEPIIWGRPAFFCFFDSPFCSYLSINILYNLRKWLKLLQNGEARKGLGDPIPHFTWFWLSSNPTIWGMNRGVRYFRISLSLASQSIWFGLGLLSSFQILNEFPIL